MDELRHIHPGEGLRAEESATDHAYRGRRASVVIPQPRQQAILPLLPVRHLQRGNRWRYAEL